VYRERGAEQWQLIKSLLPADFDIAGKRALDFGCGAGRILRHAAAQDVAGEFWGCDIDEPSIKWLRENLSPPLHVLRNGPSPPLALPDGQFDLIWAFSVFTHLTDTWSAWLTEMHRLLKPDGILIATVFGPGHTSFGEQLIDDERIGMNVLYPDAPWETGGPLVLHSKWWLAAHWGRAFGILDFHVGSQDGAPPLYGQSALVMRRRPDCPGLAELERPEAGEPRECTVREHALDTLHDEVADLKRRLDVVYTSRSWRLTAPLRKLAALPRARARRTH
jgi:SAM-dependent methyltransferase